MSHCSIHHIFMLKVQLASSLGLPLASLETSWWPQAVGWNRPYRGDRTKTLPVIVLVVSRLLEWLWFPQTFQLLSNQQQYVKTHLSSLPLRPTGFIKPNLYFQSEWFLFFSLCGTFHSFTAAPWVVGNFHANHGRPEQSNMDQRHRKQAFGAAPPLQLLADLLGNLTL